MNKKLYVRIKDLGIHTTAPSNTYRTYLNYKYFLIQIWNKLLWKKITPLKKCLHLKLN